MSEWMIKGAFHPVGIASRYAARNLPHTVFNPSSSCRVQPSQQPKRYMEWKQRANLCVGWVLQCNAEHYFHRQSTRLDVFHFD
jgi:hypothetical protein